MEDREDESNREDSIRALRESYDYLVKYWPE